MWRGHFCRLPSLAVAVPAAACVDFNWHLNWHLGKNRLVISTGTGAPNDAPAAPRRDGDSPAGGVPGNQKRDQPESHGDDRKTARTLRHQIHTALCDIRCDVRLCHHSKIGSSWSRRRRHSSLSQSLFKSFVISILTLRLFDLQIFPATVFKLSAQQDRSEG